MRISRNADFFNAIANHPRVHPSVSQAGDGAIDLAPAWDSCMGFEFEDGGWVFQRIGDRLFEVHTLFLPKAKQVLQKAKLVAHTMFCSTDAERLVTKVPADLPHARRLAEGSGFRHMYRLPLVWRRDFGAVDMDYFAMGLDDWIVTNSVLTTMGGQPGPRGAYIGYALACTEYGQDQKGRRVYDAWARFTNSGAGSAQEKAGCPPQLSPP